MKILLTGFEPFLSHSVNPTIDLVNDLKSFLDADVKTLILPVVYSEVQSIIDDELNQNTYDLICSFGLAADRKQVNHEIFAQNYIHSNSPDNNGVLIKHEQISLNHPPLLKTTWTINDAVLAPSFHAGNYLCNYVYFTFLKSHQINTSIAFVHIPMVKKDNEEYIKIRNQILTFIENEIEVKKYEKN